MTDPNKLIRWNPAFGAPPMAMPTAVEPRRRRSDFATAEAAMVHLREAQAAHPLWDCELLRACQQGDLAKDDFRFVFAQYYLYSRNFTRYLAAVMANCENDFFRSRLSENLWDEGGGQEPARRHAQIFRDFLQRGLDLDIEQIEFLDSTRNFVRDVLDFCIHAHPAAGAAFLSLGTEGIVGRLYQVFVDGLQSAGVHEPLEFFHLHIGCDDEHAATLEQMTCHYFEEPSWYDTCLNAMYYALGLRQRFFDDLLAALPRVRTSEMFRKLQAGASLAPPADERPTFVHAARRGGEPLYKNTDDGNGISLEVERLPFRPEVLDPRIARIGAGKSNERHHHAHETLMYFIEGQGDVTVDGMRHPVKVGDVVFVPRWAYHQVINTGAEDIVYLAVTDYGLASKAFVGDYLKGHRAIRSDKPR